MHRQNDHNLDTYLGECRSTRRNRADGLGNGHEDQHVAVAMDSQKQSSDANLTAPTRRRLLVGTSCPRLAT